VPLPGKWSWDAHLGIFSPICDHRACYLNGAWEDSALISQPVLVGLGKEGFPDSSRPCASSVPVEKSPVLHDLGSSWDLLCPAGAFWAFS
jgi:hypothetical protein